MGFFTNDQGGILDDLMIANRGDHLFLVVNAACKDADFAHLQEHLSATCDLTLLDDRALIALQGPRAECVLAELWADVATMRFMDVAEADLHDVPCVISRSGYTGEDGFEISIPADSAEDVTPPACSNIPMSCRSASAPAIRFAWKPGSVSTETTSIPITTPVEAALEWAMQKARRGGGAREGGFPGATVILRRACRRRRRAAASA